MPTGKIFSKYSPYNQKERGADKSDWTYITALPTELLYKELGLEPKTCRLQVEELPIYNTAPRKEKIKMSKTKRRRCRSN